MEFENQPVPLDRIDTEDRAFQISSNPDIDALMSSMGEIGLIQPPVLFPRGTHFQIICGFRRIRAAAALGWDRLPARVAPKEAAPAKLAQLAIIDNMSQRALNRLEVSRSLFLLSRSIPDPAAFRKTAADMGLPAAAGDVDKFLRVPGLPRSVQQGLGEGIVSFSAALQLEEFSEKDADRTLALIREGRFSVSRQREVLLYLKEISRRDGISVSDILDQPGFRKIFQESEFDGNRMAGKVLDYVKKKRFPALAEAERKFQEHLAALNLPGNVRVDPPPCFEGDWFQLTIRFRNMDELGQAHRRIGRLLHGDPLQKLLHRPE